jgi:hypothetical protein
LDSELVPASLENAPATATPNNAARDRDPMSHDLILFEHDVSRSLRF